MKRIQNRIWRLIFLMAVAMPMNLLAQIGNPPSNPGDNPDARPQDVPFDGRLSWFLIAAGLILAIVVLRKYTGRRKAA